jgi:hypothetical protein
LQVLGYFDWDWGYFEMDIVGNLYRLARGTAVAVFRHYLTVLAAVIFGVVAAIGISLLRGPIYSTTIIVKAAEQQGGGGGALSRALKALPV